MPTGAACFTMFLEMSLPRKFPLPLERSGPRPIMQCFHTPNGIYILVWFSRFSTARDCDQQTDRHRQTTLQREQQSASYASRAMRRNTTRYDCLNQSASTLVPRITALTLARDKRTSAIGRYLPPAPVLRQTVCTSLLLYWLSIDGTDRRTGTLCGCSCSCSLAVLDPRVGHTMDVLSPFIPVLCHSD